MNFLSFSGLVVFLSSIGCFIFIFSSRSLDRVKFLWSLFNIAVALWGASFFLGFSAADQPGALFWFRFLCVTSILIPLFFLQFSLFFSEENPNYNHFLILNYLLSAGYFLAVVIFPGTFIQRTTPRFGLEYYPSAGSLFWIFPVLYSYQWICAALLLYRKFRHSRGAVREQARYILIGIALAYLGGGSTFFGVVGIDLFPYPAVLVSLYVVLIAYATIRHRLMDIRVAVTSAGIFFLTYALALGMPFYFHHIGYKFEALLMAILLATAAPFIYARLKKRAEDSILSDQKLYQDILLRASEGFSRLKSLEEITRFVVQVFPKVMRLKSAAFYLYDGQRLSLKDSFGGEVYAPEIPSENRIVACLKSSGAVLVDELRDELGAGREAALFFKDHPAAAALAVTRDARLLGIIFLGEKMDGIPFSERDLMVLRVIADHTALAMENSRHWADAMRRMEEDGQRERMASLDAMASSLAHEIDNPNTIIIGQADLVGETIDMPEVVMPEGIRADIKRSLGYMIEASRRVAGMVQTILEYSRMGRGGLNPVRIDPAVDAFEFLINPQMKKYGVVLHKDIAPDLPLILGDKVQLEEIFMNFATNGIFAVRGNREDKRLTLRIYRKGPDLLRIEFTDNGQGIFPWLLKDVFLPSVTTKGSAEGTGLGLYRVRKIVDFHNGEVWAESQGEGRGSCFVVELPVYKGDEGEFQVNTSRKVF